MKKDEEREVLEVVLEVLEVFLEVSYIFITSGRTDGRKGGIREI